MNPTLPDPDDSLAEAIEQASAFRRALASRITTLHPDDPEVQQAAQAVLNEWRVLIGKLWYLRDAMEREER